MTNTARSDDRVRGDLVLHPVALTGLVVLLLNDHVLKAAAPGFVTGKLSDLAGMAFFPFLLLAARDVLLRRPPTARSAWVAAVVTASTFTAVKLSDPARDVYATVVGRLRYPADALLTGTGSPVPVVIQPDPGDVVTVVACAAVVLVVTRTRSRRTPLTRAACVSTASAARPSPVTVPAGADAHLHRRTVLRSQDDGPWTLMTAPGTRA